MRKETIVLNHIRALSLVEKLSMNLQARIAVAVRCHGLGDCYHQFSWCLHYTKNLETSEGKLLRKP